MARDNLVIIGPASINVVLQRFTSQLPVVEANGTLRLRDQHIAFDGKAYGLFYYNPEFPQRYIGVISATLLDVFDHQEIADLINDEGAVGFRLLEMGPVSPSLKRVRWGDNWQLDIQAGDDELFPARLEGRLAWTQAFGRAAAAATSSRTTSGVSRRMTRLVPGITRSQPGVICEPIWTVHFSSEEQC